MVKWLRCFLFVLSLTAALLMPSYQAFAQRVVRIDYQIDTNKINGGSGFLFPLPINGFGQKVTYQTSGTSAVEKVEGIDFNNLLRIVPSQQTVSVEVTVTSTMDGISDLTKYNPAGDSEYPAEAKTYLKTTYGLDHNTPTIVALAATLKSTNNLETVKSVCRYVSANVKYDFKYWRTTDEILARKVTQCEGRSAVATALLRQLGIPTRMIFMVSPNKPRGNVIDGHTIIQFYLSGCGWMMADPGSGDRIFPSVVVNYGEEPIPYYYCRVGMGALVQETETIPRDYPAMWSYLQKPQNKNEMTVATCMYDYFKVMYDCTVPENSYVNSATSITTEVYHCDKPGCRGHRSALDHCPYYCSKPGCPGHRSPNDRCR